MSELRAEIVFVDVDDTLVRSAGSKRIPITSVVERVAGLKRAGAAHVHPFNVDSIEAR
jgi:hypothetical protein